MDLYFAQFANANKKTLFSLDTDEGEKCADDFEDAEAVKEIEALASGSSSFEAPSLEHTKLYRSGDESLMRSVYEPGPDDKCYLFDRNRQWVPTIEKAHDKLGPTFVAVGVGHLLFGKDNLIDLLRARKFQVKRIEPESK